MEMDVVRGDLVRGRRRFLLGGALTRAHCSGTAGTIARYLWWSLLALWLGARSGTIPHREQAYLGGAYAFGVAQNGAFGCPGDASVCPFFQARAFWAPTLVPNPGIASTSFHHTSSALLPGTVISQRHAQCGFYAPKAPQHSSNSKDWWGPRFRMQLPSTKTSSAIARLCCVPERLQTTYRFFPSCFLLAELGHRDILPTRGSRLAWLPQLPYHVPTLIRSTSPFGTPATRPCSLHVARPRLQLVHVRNQFGACQPLS